MEPSIHHPFRALLPVPDPLRLSGEHTALLVVDMQYFDAHPDWGEGKTARQLGVLDAFDEYFQIVDGAIPQIQSLLQACRAKGVEVIHVRVSEVTNDSRDVGWKQVVRGLAVPKNSKEAELLEDVVAVGDEIIVSKSSSGAFATSNIDRLLRNLGIKTMLFTGTATGGCVESTARDAVDLGYEVVIVDDACADSTRTSHRVALQRMEAAGARICTTAEVRAAVDAVPEVDRRARSGVVRAEAFIPKTIPATGSKRSPYSMIFPPALDLPVEPRSLALILIDVQYGFAHPEHGLARRAIERGLWEQVAPFYDRVETALPNMRRLADACRAAGAPVIYVRTAVQMPDGRELSPKLRRYGLTPTLGTRFTEILSDVAPQPGDVILNKTASGVCAGTGIDEVLQNAGIETVVLAGVSFDGALEGSVRSLTDRSFALFLPPDACATFDERLQQGLRGMESGIINVVSTSDLVARIAAARGEHGRAEPGRAEPGRAEPGRAAPSRAGD
jgi:nicotinamidase-related amidase